MRNPLRTIFGHNIQLTQIACSFSALDHFWGGSRNYCQRTRLYYAGTHTGGVDLRQNATVGSYVIHTGCTATVNVAFEPQARMSRLSRASPAMDCTKSFSCSGAAMYPGVEEHVFSAADELHAAVGATTRAEQQAHRDAARDWIALIQCNGNLLTRRILKAREVARAQ
jgi:hypothetical protein